MPKPAAKLLSRVTTAPRDRSGETDTNGVRTYGRASPLLSSPNRSGATDDGCCTNSTPSGNSVTGMGGYPGRGDGVGVTGAGTRSLQEVAARVRSIQPIMTARMAFSLTVIHPPPQGGSASLRLSAALIRCEDIRLLK